MATATKRARSPHQPTGQWIRPEKRLAIYLRDGFRCLYCSRDLRDASPADIHLDHVVCRADGGSNDAANLVTACRACNCSRQDRSVRSFASPEARAEIRRNTRRSLSRYLALAKAIIAGQAAAAELESR
ncbi:MAG: HNH endonuclease [Candidatus Nanopelagicales bacterium]